MSEDFAAARRADYVRALREEREGCERQGKTDRVRAIDAELERVTGEPVQRAAAPQQTAAPAKKAAASRRR